VRVLRRGKEKREPLSAAMRHHFLTGEYSGPLTLGPRMEVFTFHDEQKGALWRAHAPELLRDWIRERPGTRPWAWWTYDAPASPRECVGAVFPLAPLWRQAFGRPFEWHALEAGMVLALESEPHYLRRHALLAPGERRRIPQADYAPEQITVTNEEED